MSRADWTPQAEADLTALYEYIASCDHRLSVTKEVVRKLRDHCDEYSSLVAAGHVLGTARDDFAEGVRVFTHQRWVVIFRPNESGIEILRIFDGSRDYPHLFRVQ
jgi:plasmid stabilization system protein ParE